MIRKVFVWLNSLITVLCFINICTVLAMRPIWVYINQQVSVAFIPGVMILLAANTAVFAVGIVQLFFRLKTNFKKTNIGIILIIVSILLTGINIYIMSEMGSNRQIVYDSLFAALRQVIKFSPVLALLLLVAVYQRFKFIRNKLFITSSITVVFVILIFVIGDFGKVRITSGPFIQAVDNSNIAVIWTTNYKSTGYVEFGVDADNLQKITMSKNGLVEANNSTHKVLLPVGEIKDFVYRVGSTRIKKLDEEGAVFGNTVISDLKQVSDFKNKDTVSFYTLNDVHGKSEIYKKFLSDNEYDFLVLNGDSLDCIESPVSFLKQVMQPIARYTGSEKPFFFVRGNHEARGGYARELSDSLYLPDGRYYYTFKAGPLFAIVLDSGDGGDRLDKSEFNYGLVLYEQYREKETEWLKAVCNSEEYKNAVFKIAFVHVPLNTSVEQADIKNNKYIREWRNLFNSTGIDIVFSGHTHVPEIVKPDFYEVNFPTIIGGGNSYKDYVAVKTVVTSSEMKVFYEKLDGGIQEVYSVKK